VLAVAPTAAPARRDPDAPAVLLDFVKTRVRLHRNTLLVVVTSAHGLRLVVNLLVSLEKVGIPAALPLILCLDRTSFGVLSTAAAKLTTFLVDQPGVWQELEWPRLSLPDAEAAAVLDGDTSQAWVELTWLKQRLLQFIVARAGLQVLSMDTDVVLLPAKPAHAVDMLIDMLVRRGPQGPDRACVVTPEAYIDQITKRPERNTGFLVMRPDAPCIQLLAATEALIRRWRTEAKLLNEQIAFNLALQALHMDARSVLLKHWSFVSGRDMQQHPVPDWMLLGLLGWPSNRARNFPALVHMNGFKGALKVAALKAIQLWWSDDLDVLRSLQLPYIAPSSAELSAKLQ
jgi:hypothetical protein